jgi:hypothetical protein
MGSGIALVDGFYLWASSYGSNMNYVIEDEFLKFDQSTWGIIKAADGG